MKPLDSTPTTTSMFCFMNGFDIESMDKRNKSISDKIGVMSLNTIPFWEVHYISYIFSDYFGSYFLMT